MPTPKKGTDLPKDVDSRLTDLYQRVRMQRVAMKLRMDVLTDEERDRVKETPDEVIRLPQTFAEIRGLSLARAVIELALESGFLGYGEYLSLRRKIGEPIDESKTKKIPIWDSITGELFFNGKVVRKVSSRAKNVRVVLGTFQENGWPSYLMNPLPGGAISRRLRETIRTLNKNLSIIRFYADGKAEGILWQIED